MADLALFDIDPSQVREPEPNPMEGLSADRRRTLRQLEALHHGQHPLGLLGPPMLRLHHDVPPADDRTAAGPRCGTCRFRETVGHHDKRYAKCLRGWDPAKYLDTAPYASHSAASDCRAWWPAYEGWEPLP